MNSISDYVSSASGLPYAVEALLLGRKRQISTQGGLTIIPDVVVSEEHDDEVVVTRHPVDTGAAIADHAYKNPSVLTCVFAWSDSSRLLNSSLSGSILKGVTTTKEVYEKLLEVMENRELLSVSTGKRQYSNMLITRLRTSSTVDSESSLSVEITFEEIVFASLAETTLSAALQADPAATASTQNGGTVRAETVTTYPVLIPTSSE